MTATTAAGRQIAVGPRDGPTIVFVHATRLTGSFWTAQQAALGREFHTLAPDLPAHGTRAADPFTLDTAADVVAATIRADASGGRAVVVGLSLGGYVAMTLAAREPELVRGLVLSGASVEPVGPRTVAFRIFAAAMDRADDVRFDRINARFFRQRYPPAIAEPIIAGGFWPHGGAAAVRALVGQRFIPRLAAYPGPSVIVNGELDVVFRPGARAFAAAACDARRVRIAGASHLANLDRPAAFSEAVRRFARSVEAF